MEASSGIGVNLRGRRAGLRLARHGAEGACSDGGLVAAPGHLSDQAALSLGAAADRFGRAGPLASTVRRRRRIRAGGSLWLTCGSPGPGTGGPAGDRGAARGTSSEEPTSEIQSLMR